jgi:hypothetical protein
MTRMWLTLGTVLAAGALVGCGMGPSAYKPAPLQFAEQGRPDAAMAYERDLQNLGPAGAEFGRTDAAAGYERDLQKLAHTDLNFANTPVQDVLKEMQEKFSCRIVVTRPAAQYIADNDTRVTARVESVPANLAFAVVRAELEFKGLMLIPVKNALGRPAFRLDRNTADDLSAGAPAKGGADF